MEIIAVRLEIRAKHVSVWCGQKIGILNTFEKLRKVDIGLVRSVCLSVRPHGKTRLQLKLF